MLGSKVIILGSGVLLCADFIKEVLTVAPHSAPATDIRSHDDSVKTFDPAGDVLDRTCSLCGRGQTELQRAGHSLRFLCPDEVCTECIDDDVAAA
jgi:hypothetical protein